MSLPGWHHRRGGTDALRIGRVGRAGAGTRRKPTCEVDARVAEVRATCDCGDGSPCRGRRLAWGPGGKVTESGCVIGGPCRRAASIRASQLRPPKRESSYHDWCGWKGAAVGYLFTIGTAEEDHEWGFRLRARCISHPVTPSPSATRQQPHGRTLQNLSQIF